MILNKIQDKAEQDEIAVDIDDSLLKTSVGPTFASAIARSGSLGEVVLRHLKKDDL